MKSSRPPARWYHPRPLLRRIVVCNLVLYALLIVGLLATRKLQMYPGSVINKMTRDDATRQAHDAGLVPWTDPALPADAGPEGFCRPDFTAPAPRGTVIAFHGSGRWAVPRIYYTNAISLRGFRVLLYEYPGYDGRSGEPGEETIIPDARALVRSLDRSGLGPVYLLGESLGSGIAAEVCADRSLPVRGIVLITAWDTLTHVANYRFPGVPAGYLLDGHYDTIANLRNFAHPVCLVRSSGDSVIPAPLTLHLYSELTGPKKMIVLDGKGHDNWPREPKLGWWDETLDFIAPVKRTGAINPL